MSACRTFDCRLNKIEERVDVYTRPHEIYLKLETSTVASEESPVGLDCMIIGRLNAKLTQTATDAGEAVSQ